MQNNNQLKALSKPMWWGLFLLATFLLSNVVEQFKVFTIAPALFEGVKLILLLVGLLLSAMILMADSYLKERQKGEVSKEIALFEWYFSKQQSRQTTKERGETHGR